jgi:chromosome partitioning protein
MRNYALANQKGGVGKSAITKNLGAALAEMGQRVLLVDLDPQGHLTRALGLPNTPAPATLANALLGQWSGELRELVTPYRDRLGVIATNPDMFLLEPQMYAKPGREYLLSRLLDALAPAYDVCLIDCPPSLGALTDNALMATRCDPQGRRGAVLVPVQAEDSSLDALRLLFDQVRTVEQALGVTLAIAGLIINLYDGRRGRIATSTLEAMQAMQGIDVLAVIGDRTAIREAWRLHLPVIEHAPGSDAAAWFRELAKRVQDEGAS